MPSEAFTALLLQKTAAANPARPQGADEAVVEGALNHIPEALVDVAGSDEVNEARTEFAVLKEKDRKRHRGGSSSRSHHKKSKEAVVGGVLIRRRLWQGTPLRLIPGRLSLQALTLPGFEFVSLMLTR